MSELELFGWALTIASGLCAALWVTVAGCFAVSVVQWGIGMWKWWRA